MFKKLMPVILVLTALPAGAATVYYTQTSGNNEAAFDNATGILEDYNFAGETATTFLLDAGPTGVDFFGFWSNNTAPQTLNIVGNTLQHTASNNGANGSTIRVDLPGDVRAIGLHFSITGSSTSFCIEAAGTSNCNTLFNVGSTGDTFFYGIISDASISSFQIRNQTTASKLVIKDFAVGLESSGGGGEPPSETPEPSTLALLGSALIAFPFLARRKWRQ